MVDRFSRKSIVVAESLVDVLVDDLEQCPASTIEAPASTLSSKLSACWMELSAQEKNSIREQAIRLAAQFVDESHEPDSVASLLTDLFWHRIQASDSGDGVERSALTIRWAALISVWERKGR